MQILINSYSPNAEAPNTRDFQAFQVYQLDQSEPFWSLTFRSSSIGQEEQINGTTLEKLNQIELLKDNWDGENAKVPTEHVIQMTKGLVYFMNAIGQKIYTIAPGPRGEIMLDLRSGAKSLEILIYPDKMKFVKFSESATPSQRSFTIELLHTDLLAWLNN